MGVGLGGITHSPATHEPPCVAQRNELHSARARSGVISKTIKMSMCLGPLGSILSPYRNVPPEDVPPVRLPELCDDGALSPRNG